MSVVNHDSVSHVGIDDWSMCRRHSYACIMVNLDSNEIVDMIPSRNQLAVTAWLKKYPNLTIVSRDGAPFFRSGIKDANSNIIQVSDKYHYIAVLTKHFSALIKRLLPAGILAGPNKGESSAPGRHQKYSRAWDRKQKLIARVKAKYDAGQTKTEICRDLQMDHRTVTEYLSGNFTHSTWHRTNSLEPYAQEFLKLRATHTNRQIYNHLVDEGYSCTYLTFMEYKQTIVHRAEIESASKYDNPTEKVVQSLLYQRKPSRQLKSAARKVMKNYPKVKKYVALFQKFIKITERKSHMTLKKWMDEAESMAVPEINSACHALKMDFEAIENSIKFPQYSNGPVEGKNNKTKLIKRTMYGRCGFEAVRQKMILLERI